MKHFENTLVQSAYEFANAAHESVNQRRKYTNEPYIVHPLAVAKKLEELGCRDAVIAAGLLHDVVEDTPVTIEQIVEKYGDDIAQLVQEVTDTARPEDGNRAARMAINRAHTALASKEGKTLKAADINDNWDSIVRYAGGFAYKWVPEKILQIDVLRDGADPRILKEIDEKITKWTARLKR